MRKNIHSVTTQIRAIETVSNNIKIFTLTDPDDWPLPQFNPGSHIDVFLYGGKVRQYSLCGNPENNGKYLIAVQKEEYGRGGSEEMHQLEVGMILPVSLPRNHFPLAEAKKHIFVAGGIGITPFLSMIPWLTKHKITWELHICANSEDKLVCEQLLDSNQSKGSVHKHITQNGTRLSMNDLLSEVGSEEHLYVCGPESMISEAIRSGAFLENRLHFEKFGVDHNLKETAYEVVLKKSGNVVKVPKGQTMLGALRLANVDISASCEGGICLECKTQYLEGAPIHRDLVMQPVDREKFVTPCVSGCASDKLILDL